MNSPDITVVIPTFNEADIIEGSLRRVSQALGETRSHTEVIIADDGKDNLPEVVDRCRKSLGFAHLIVKRNVIPLGKGDAIAKAFMVAQGKVVGFIDVDFSVVPERILDAVAEIHKGYDICIASRVGNRLKTDKSLLTSVTATIFRILHRCFIFGFSKGFRDTQCGFKFFRREVAVDLFSDLVAMDGLADLEVLLKASRKGYTVAEIHVPRVNDRESKKNLSRIFAYEAISLWRIFCKYTLHMRVASIPASQSLYKGHS